MRRAKSSISWTYFASTATIMLVAVFIMGVMQIGLSIRYFANERRNSLTNVINITQAQLETLQGSAAMNGAGQPGDLTLINSTTDAMLTLADSDGKVLLNVGDNGQMGGGTIPADIRAELDEGRDCFIVGDMEGLFLGWRFSVGRRVLLQGKPYYVFASTPSLGMTNYVSDMMSAFVFSGGLTLLVASLLSIFLAERMAKPLRNIAMAAQRFGGGDFSVRVPEEGDAELRQLATTFNTMAANLQAIDNSRSQFMGNIAHELRTPMTSIKGFVDGMLDGTIPPEMQPHYLELVSQEAGRLARLVQNMLDITKLEAGEYEVHAIAYDIWESVTGVVVSDEQRIEEGKIEIRGLEPSRTQVYADPDLIHQVVYNLVDNAIKFTPEGGYIEFKVARRNGMVEVSIQNSGRGISPEALPFVFERFYKEDKSRSMNIKGSGLGLHICKVLVTMQGGTITVDSKENEWARFAFTLPENPPEEKKRKK